MLASKADREAGLVTFLATSSGIALFGLGSAFWGLVTGALALGAKALSRYAPPPRPRSGRALSPHSAVSEAR